MRVVSLLPSATEILHAVGAADQVVGVTFECDSPSSARRDATVVSTSNLPTGLTPAEIDRAVRTRIAAGEDLYRLDRAALSDLDADLVVTQDLCAVCAVDVSEVRDALDFLQCRADVLTTDPHTLDEVWASIEAIGEAVSQQEAAAALARSLRERMTRVGKLVAGRDAVRCLVLEWSDPPFAPGHWVPEMVSVAGGHSVLGEAGVKSRATSWRSVAAANPDVIVVAPCGYALPESTHIAQDLLLTNNLPDRCEVWAVDANASFARPGPRLADGVEALARIMHPDLGAPDASLATRLR
ncbi:ABC transporter substrate-binding protein [Demetria terragena]|uniref:ABC transporter substrate-binding protein n=1 Tax=Demetria terragena TaxID=63959 RepID=UPI0003760554|nr:ABC transporter substrate-binding protein [Demetria terragena]